MRNMSALGHVFLFRMNEPPQDPRLWSASKPQSLLMPFLTATTKNQLLGMGIPPFSFSVQLG